ncbi:MAG TPA: ATP-binding protein [Ktedonobacteraceae bacterium]|nr:ATP-binding protein [Ktedonobacteraceae bacterium]
MELVIMIGLQASGKTTFARSRFGETYRYVSKDLMKNSGKARKQRQLIEEALQQGLSVVVDNTNPTIAERKELIDLGHLYHAEITGYFFAVQLKQCLERNRAREGKARVPDVAIFATLKKLTRPSYAEGFTKLFYVHNKGDQNFEVSDWQEEESTGERQ